MWMASSSWPCNRGSALIPSRQRQYRGGGMTPSASSANGGESATPPRHRMASSAGRRGTTAFRWGPPSR
jgi:hypothetical protein